MSMNGSLEILSVLTHLDAQYWPGQVLLLTKCVGPKQGRYDKSAEVS
jgi:hypothetical protein